MVNSRWLSNISTAVAIAGASSSYTDVSTHTASTRTTCDTHAPRATNDSAADTRVGSSRATRRTRTFVSTARMAPLRVGPKTLPELGQASTARRLGEKRRVQIGRCEPPDAPKQYPLAFLMPLEGGPRADAKLPTHFRGNRDLTLCSQARLGDRHMITLPRYCNRVKPRCPPHSRPNTDLSGEAPKFTGLRQLQLFVRQRRDSTRARTRTGDPCQ